MSALADFLTGHGRKLRVAVYPWPDQLFHNDLKSRHRTIWRRWAEARNDTFIDLFPAFFARIDGDPRRTIGTLYLDGDVHFSERGHDLVASRLQTLWSDTK